MKNPPKKPNGDVFFLSKKKDKSRIFSKFAKLK